MPAGYPSGSITSRVSCSRRQHRWGQSPPLGKHTSTCGNWHSHLPCRGALLKLIFPFSPHQDYVPLTFSISLFAIGSNYTNTHIEKIVAKVAVKCNLLALLCFLTALLTHFRVRRPHATPPPHAVVNQTSVTTPAGADVIGARTESKLSNQLMDLRCHWRQSLPLFVS